VIQEPVQPTTTPPPTPPGARRSRVALAIAACLALALPLAVVIAARPSEPASLTAGASAGTGASTAPGASERPDKDPGKGHGPKGDKTLRGNGELKGNGARAKGGVTIGAVNGSSVTLATEDGWSRTVVITSSTALTKGGQSITVSDLHVGDAVRFHQVRNADGSFTVDAMAVLVPQAGGEVTAVDATTITVRRGGSTRVIHVTGATAYKLGSAPAGKTDVTVGSRVEAQGSLDGDTFTASTVTIHLPEVGGEVVAKSGDSITLKRADGSTTVVHVTSKTTYEVKGKEPAALGDISVGDRVNAEGKRRDDGSLDAVSVEARAPKSAKPDKHTASPSASPG
jgi:hypothetical protein